MQYPIESSPNLQHIEEAQPSPSEKQQFQIEFRLYQIQNDLLKMDSKDTDAIKQDDEDSKPSDTSSKMQIMEAQEFI